MTQITREVTAGTGDELQRRADVEGAAKELASAIAETPEAKAFEEAYVRLRDDQQAQAALVAFESKQQALQAMIMLGALDEDERAELDRLRQAWMDEPSVTAYLDAQASLAALCRSVDRGLSDRIGLGFAAACGPSCCG